MREKVGIVLYLFIISILAVNIHIQMLKSGVPYPGEHFLVPKWYDALKVIVQLFGLYWLSGKVASIYSGWGVVKKTAAVFLIMAAMMELLLRLPLTAGYVNGQAFLFTWVAAYLPKLIWLLVSVIVVLLLSNKKQDSQLKYIIVKLVVIVIYAILSVVILMPLLTGLCAKLLPLLTPPNPANIIPSPYNFTTTVITSIFYIEPVIACFIVAYLIWSTNSSFIWQCIKVTFAILVLNQGLVTFVVFMLHNNLPFMNALLSVGQFTMESIFIGIMISILLFYLKRKPKKQGNIL